MQPDRIICPHILVHLFAKIATTTRMARYIVCTECDNHMKEAVKEFDECYESVEGKAIKEMLCDTCPSRREIKKGEKCFAAVLLPSKEHENYEKQFPTAWCDKFIERPPLKPTTSEADKIRNETKRKK